MIEGEYDFFSIKQFSDLFLLDDINSSDFMVYVPDNIMSEMLSLCNDFEVYFVISGKKYGIVIINCIRMDDFNFSTEIITKETRLSNDVSIKIKLYFHDIIQFSNFKIKYTK